jgi:hypothetical protein
MLPKSICFDSDGNRLAVLAPCSRILILNPADGATVRQIEVPDDLVFGMAFAANHSLATVTDNHRLQLWNSATGAALWSVANINALTGIAVSPDGTTIAGCDMDGQMHLWNAETGALLHTMSGKIIGAMACAFSPDGRWIFVGSMNEVLKFDRQTGRLEGRLKSHANLVLSISCGLDGVVASAGADQIKLWDRATDRQLASLVVLPSRNQGESEESGNLPEYLVATPEGYYSGSVEASRRAHFGLGNDSYPVESFRARLERPDLVMQSLRNSPPPPLVWQGAVPPLAAVLSPGPGERVRGSNLTVQVEASDDSRVNHVLCLVNGARVELKPSLIGQRPIIIGSRTLVLGGRLSIPPRHTVSCVYSATVALPATRNIKIQAVAVDSDGLQSPHDEIVVQRDRTEPDTAKQLRGRLLALCVGVSSYRDPRLKLTYAARDALALSQMLQAQVGLYGNPSVMTLTDAHATQSSVLAALDKLITQATKEDTAVVFLAGHGWRDATRRFYFATYNVEPLRLQQTAIPWSAVIQKLARLSEKSRRVVVLLDACHSGSAATNDDMVRAVLQANAGVIVVASSRGNEVSLEDSRWQHGLFTQSLLDAMADRNAASGNGEVTLWNLMTYLKKRVALLSADRQHPQVPFLQDFDTDAALLRQAPRLHGR